MTSPDGRRTGYGGWWIALAAVVVVDVFVGLLVWSYWSAPGISYIN